MSPSGEDWFEFPTSAHLGQAAKGEMVDDIHFKRHALRWEPKQLVTTGVARVLTGPCGGDVEGRSIWESFNVEPLELEVLLLIGELKGRRLACGWPILAVNDCCLTETCMHDL